MFRIGGLHDKKSDMEISGNKRGLRSFMTCVQDFLYHASFFPSSDWKGYSWMHPLSYRSRDKTIVA